MSGPLKVLGISAYFHDAAAALLIDGTLVAAAQEERFTRKKHDAGLPVNAVRFCLEQAGLQIDDLDHVVFYEKPLRKLERILVTSLRELPRGLSSFTRAMATWLGKRLWLKSDLCAQLGCRPEQLLFSEHHLSHAASAFFCSDFAEAAVITADGVGEWTTTGIYHGKSDAAGSTLTLVAEQHFPHSLGLLYSALTAYLGFEVNEGEYKVMGLASYGTPRFAAELSQICRVGDDGSIELAPRFFAFPYHAEKSFTPALEALLGPARAPHSELSFDPPPPESQRFADVAASLQALTEEAMLRLAGEAQRRTGATSLCLAGGVALNSVANRRLAEEGPFERLFVQPAAGDAGGALGAALWVSHVLHGLPRAAPMTSAAWGQGFTDLDIVRFLEDCAVPHQHFESPEALDAAVAELLAAGLVGAVLQGRFEWGPRSLGQRSILADPRQVATRERVNRKVKFREPFRPFAPAVLEEDVGEWFALGKARDRALWPFMCAVVPANDKARAQIPAVVHVDGTARLQTVGRSSQPRFHSLISAFKERTGVGVLLNTSMNLKDEPICGSPAEAYGTFLRSDLDFLALEQCLVRKDPHA